MEQIPNEPNTVRIKFRANPKPTDCRWTIAENDETQKNQSCKILLCEGIKGEYFVNLSATSEDPILLFITNELGTKFQSKEAEKIMAASFSNINLTIPLSIVLPLLCLFSLVGCFIFRRRQRRNIFKNPNRTPTVSNSTTYSYSTMMSRDSRKTCNITSNMGISADTTKRKPQEEKDQKSGKSKDTQHKLEIGDRLTSEYKSFRIGESRQKRLDKSVIKGVSRETVRPPKASELSNDMF